MNTFLLLLALAITPQDLVNCNVYVETDTHEGSGVLFTHNGEAYVLTAGHVIQPPDAEVSVTHVSGDVEIKVKADVLARSDDNHHDLALLHLKTNVFKQIVEFADDPPQEVGTELYHVGNFAGRAGLNSLSTGVISHVKRKIPGCDIEFDQVTVTAFPGSSGGGVYSKTGQLVGLIVRLKGPNFGAIVPIRRIRAWAAEEGVDFVFDPCEPTPALEQP